MLAEIPLLVSKNPTGTTHGFEIALVVGAVALIVWGQVHQRRMAREERDSAPRLVVGGVLVKEWPLNPRLDAQGFTTGDVLTMASGIDMAGHTDERERIHAAHLHVTNEPKNKKSKQMAENVTLSIRYLRDGEEIVPPLNGRWSGDDQLSPFEWTQRASERSISTNNRNPERLDVAIKYPADNECCAMDDTVRFNAGDWRKYPLGPGPVEVEVTALQAGEASRCESLVAYAGRRRRCPSTRTTRLNLSGPLRDFMEAAIE